MKSHIHKLNLEKAKEADKAKLNRVVKATLDQDYNTAFSSPGGIRVLNDLFSKTHIFGLSYTFNGKDQGDFRDGERNIGLILTKIMRRVNKKTLFSAFDVNLKQEHKKK